MQAPVAVVHKRSLPKRVVAGICLTTVSMLLLVFPGGFEMPLMAVAPLLSGRASPCFNFLALPLVLVVFGFGALLTVGLLAVGITAIVLTLTQVPGGLISAVLVNVVVASLYLLFLSNLTPGDFSGHNELATTGLFYSAVAAVPLAASALLLSPSLYRTARTFVVTLVVAGILLLPGAVGLAVFGLNVAGVTVATSSHPSSTHC